MKNEIRSLTGIRGIAAIWILLLHFGEELAVLIPQFAVLAPIYGKGNVGVDLFFVLSGYIITCVYSHRGTWSAHESRGYIVRRIARIYPNHLITLLALGGMVLTARALGKTVDGSYGTTEFIGHLFMLQGFPMIEDGAWNYPSWSVSVEFFGYLAIFPLSLILCRSSAARRHGLLASVVLTTTFSLCKHQGIFGDWVRVAKISFEFLAGAFLFHGLVARPAAQRIIAAALPISLLMTVCLFYLAPSAAAMTSYALIAACPLLIAGISSDHGAVSKLLGTSQIRYLGLISYALYMSHALVEKALKVALPVDKFAEAGIAVRLAAFSVHLLLPFVAAALLYHFWEEPIRKLIQRMGRRWTTPPSSS